jgi:hypothetical protein
MNDPSRLHSEGYVETSHSNGIKFMLEQLQKGMEQELVQERLEGVYAAVRVAFLAAGRPMCREEIAQFIKQGREINDEEYPEESQWVNRAVNLAVDDLLEQGSIRIDPTTVQIWQDGGEPLPTYVNVEPPISAKPLSNVIPISNR